MLPPLFVGARARLLCKILMLSYTGLFILFYSVLDGAVHYRIALGTSNTFMLSRFLTQR